MFIKVHNIEDNSTIIINTNHIITIEKDGDDNVIYCINENVVRVFEKPEKIFEMINKK